MLMTIDGLRYVYILESGIKNLVKHKQQLNDLNVFPVPDGDTGTNMASTLKNGYQAIDKPADAIEKVAKQFATSAVFGARGNSGVIVSQFFKGIADAVKGKSEIDASGLLFALESGYQFAYRAVLKPVEGTMLTVVREAVEAVKKAGEFESIDALIDAYLQAAHLSLSNTPKLLPVLKKAGVVDSGGAGIVCFFEGVQKYLRGEDIEAEEEIAVAESVDLTKFNKDTNFVYGYCTEGVLQLKIEPSEFNQEWLRGELARLGDSIVMTLEGDKVKLHVHSKTPGNVINACQCVGEFLTIKIENMTVQNADKLTPPEEEVKKYLYSEEKSPFDFAVVAVASNPFMQKTLFEMGADVVILSEIAPSAQDFIDAFALAGKKEILVFPNSSNSILTSMHAGSLYKKARVTVLNSRSVEECYLSLGLIDFEDSMQRAVDVVNESISALYQVRIYRAVKDVTYGKQKVNKNEFFALCEKNIVETGASMQEVVLGTVEKTLAEKDFGVLTIFFGLEMAEEFIAMLEEKIKEKNPLLETVVVATQDTSCEIALAFE